MKRNAREQISRQDLIEALSIIAAAPDALGHRDRRRTANALKVAAELLRQYDCARSRK